MLGNLLMDVNKLSLRKNGAGGGGGGVQPAAMVLSEASRGASSGLKARGTFIALRLTQSATFRQSARICRPLAAHHLELTQSDLMVQGRLERP